MVKRREKNVCSKATKLSHSPASQAVTFVCKHLSYACGSTHVFKFLNKKKKKIIFIYFCNSEGCLINRYEDTRHF